MPTLTYKASDVAQYILDLLIDQGPSLSTPLKTEDIYYGDQALIPRTPAVTVEPGSVDRTLVGAPNAHTSNTVRVILMVYWQQYEVGKGKQFNDKSGDVFAESVADLLNADLQMGGYVMHGFVTSVEPGYTSRSRNTYRTTRITWEGLSHTRMVA